VPTTGKYGESTGYFIFDSDSIDNYEIGYKGTAATLNYAVSLYYAEWQDPQLNTATSNWGFFAAINGESAETQGIEIELSGTLGDHLSYSLGYTYADSELSDDVYQPAGNFYLHPGRPEFLDRVGAEGDRLPGSAEHVFNVSLGYEFQLADGVSVNTVLSGYYQSEVLNSLGDDTCEKGFSTLSGNCRDTAYPDSVNYAPMSVYSRAYAEIDSFQLWNLSTTLSKDDWAASLYVKNLFDEDGTTGVFTWAQGGSNTSASQNYYGNNSRDYIALPRTLGASVTYSF